MPKLTKAQLLARIAEVEEQCGLKDHTIAQMQRELNAAHYEQRPSRARHRGGDTHVMGAEFPVVKIRGELFAKVPSFEGGRRVITYRPIAAH